jgi:hypothetical protein
LASRRPPEERVPEEKMRDAVIDVILSDIDDFLVGGMGRPKAAGHLLERL